MRVSRFFGCILTGAILATACTPKSDVADPTPQSETSILPKEDVSEIEATAEFLVCFNAAAKDHPLEAVQLLAADNDETAETADTADLSDDDALAIALFLQSLDSICPGA